VRLLLAGLLLSAPVFAHHSFASTYFMDQRTKIEGTLVEFSPRNPHSFVQVEAPDPKTGAMATWVIEWRSAQRLTRQGINNDTLKPGDHIIILGNPGRTAGEYRLHMLGISRTSDGWKYGQAVQ
jgi:uncharacterized protein DUF6152